MRSKRPPFQITGEILSLSQNISRSIGLAEGARLESQPVRLRKDSNIRTIHASLAIEGNTLSLDQVTDIVNHKRVLGPKKDIQEAKNAALVYESFDELNPLSKKDFFKAHQMLMEGLIDEAGRLRSGSVGVFKGAQVAHVAPPAKKVPELIDDLFDFLKKDKETPWLLKACVFHYELEFIHPFSDGSGRMGRLWQQLLLTKEASIFRYLSVEELIKASQKEYYAVLHQSDRAGESTAFIAYSLKQILQALQSYYDTARPSTKDAQSRLLYASKIFGDEPFARKAYLKLFKDISTSTASRDLQFGVESQILSTSGASNQTRYTFSVRVP